MSLVLALAVFIVASQANAATLARPGARRGRRARRHAEASATGDEPAVAAPLVATDVRIEVAGIVARTTLTQRFVNPTPVWREGVYLFPLPDKAAVDHMRVETGGRVIEGEVQSARGEAGLRGAKRTGSQAGLVEQERPNLFTTSVALLPPDDEVVVTIEYQETLRYDAGTFSLRFPLAMTPRYIPGKHASPRAPRTPSRISMPIHLDAPPVTSPSSSTRGAGDDRASKLDAGFPWRASEGRRTRGRRGRVGGTRYALARSPTASCRPIATSSSRGARGRRRTGRRVFTEKRTAARTRS